MNTVGPIAWLLAGALMIVVSTTVRPPKVPPASGEALVSEVLVSGRDLALADLRWLTLVQMMGEDHLPPAGQLVHQAERVMAADPTFAMAPERVAFFVVTSTSKEEDVAKLRHLLSTAIAYHPTDLRLLLARGFLSYFSTDRNDLAAADITAAAAMPGAPPYLLAMAERLRTETSLCVPEIINGNLRDLADRSGQLAQRRALIERCFRTEIKRAAGRYQLREGRRANSLQELVDAGLMANLPPRLGDQCFGLSTTGLPILEPCK